MVHVVMFFYLFVCFYTVFFIYFLLDYGKLEFSPVRLVPPERIMFGINPAVSTVTTVAEIRDQYNEVDSRLIAKEVLLFDQFFHCLIDTL